ncbi:MAG: cupin domain-containing protein [Deltaproteobacteria bacterium]|nr:cupin domain-containing protein [Deltaproteobacteria bacterium]
MTMKELTIKASEMEWKDSLEYPKGTQEKMLTEGTDVMPRAIMLKIPHDWSMNSHSHVVAELHYVLEGSYETNGETHRAGTFRVIPAHTEHGPYSSKTGAVILVTWCRRPETK